MYLSVFIKWLKDVSLSMFIKGFHLWTNDAWVCSSFFTLFFLTDRYEVFCSAFQQVNTWMVVSEMTLDCTCTGSLDIFTIFSLPRNEHVQLLPLAQKKHTKSLNRSLFSLISSDASIFFNILFRSFSFPYLYMQ